MRYRIYREHKYVIHEFTELDRYIAKANFRQDAEIAEIKQKMQSLAELMHEHAKFENERVHNLLIQKKSAVHDVIAREHAEHEKQYESFQTQLDAIAHTTDLDERVARSWDFYLNYRRFLFENLQHLHYEETVILPELQRLYTDEALKTIDFETYQQMSPPQMVEMMEVLFPHMNVSDKIAFLQDMKEAVPDKFIKAWHGILPKIPQVEQKYLLDALNVMAMLL